MTSVLKKLRTTGLAVALMAAAAGAQAQDTRLYAFSSGALTIVHLDDQHGLDPTRRVGTRCTAVPS